jgi:hypothetical protein
VAVASGLPTLLSAGVPPAYPAGGLTPSEIFIAVVGFGAVLLVGYRWSLWKRPHVTCRRCNGTGRVSGTLFFWSRAFCMRCGGTGLYPRLGTLLLDALARRQRATGISPPDSPDQIEPWPDEQDPRRRDGAGGNPSWPPAAGGPPADGGWPPV